MMNKQILTELQTAYERQREANHAEEARHAREAYAKCPELEQVAQARQELIYGSMRGILGGKQRYDDLPARMEVLNRRMEALLKQNGYPKDYLDPVYRCKACHDTGYVGEPVKEMCGCMQEAYFRRLYREVGLNDAENQSFERFDLSIFPDKPLPQYGCTQRQMMRVARDMCQEWAERFPKAQTRDLVLSGQSGLGKTYLLHCMAKVLLERGVSVMLISAFRFLELARKAHMTGDYSGLEPLKQTDVLMLDDLGSEPMMENITIVQLFSVLDERQSAGRSTVVSTNLNEKEIKERYTERVASRLLDKRHSAFIPFAGDDVRRG